MARIWANFSRVGWHREDHAPPPVSHTQWQCRGTPHPVLGATRGSWGCKPRGFAAAAVLGREIQDRARQVLEQPLKAPLVLPPCDQRGGCSGRTMLWRQEEEWFSIAPEYESRGTQHARPAQTTRQGPQQTVPRKSRLRPTPWAPEDTHDNQQKGCLTASTGTWWVACCGEVKRPQTLLNLK